MTTIVVLEGNDGVIFCADRQITGFMIKESGIKIDNIGTHGLISCSGASIYIELLTKYVEKSILKRKSKSFGEALDQAVDSYCAYIKKRNEDVGILPKDISNTYPEGVFAIYDKNDENPYHIFQIQTPHPCIEVDPRNHSRAVAGSGSLAAIMILQTIEHEMEKIGVTWKNLSTGLLSQFCSILLRRISQLEPKTSGLTIYRLDQSGYTPLTFGNVFPNRTKGESELMALMKSALREIGKEKLLKLVEIYGLLTLLGDLGFYPR